MGVLQNGGRLRGRLLCPDPTARRIDILEDGLLVVGAGGRIESVGPAPDDCATPETLPGAVWMPGLVDAHVHFPQTRVAGSATGPLLDWLDRTVFPEEARFAELAYARVVAAEFCDSLLRWGTTCAGVYSSSHPGATDALLAEMARRGLRGHVGLTLMDRGAPEAVTLAAQPALEALGRLTDDWHRHDDGRLEVCVTPRFALSCTPELLRGAADLAAARELPIQTHVSENKAEILATAAAFPASADYLSVYADHGLLGPRSLFAHCVWLGDAEWDAMADADAAVAHCPDSNFFLGSGCMDLSQPTRRGVRVGLGTDVGAGRTFSMRRVAARAYDAAVITGADADAEALLWLATAGGADAMGLGDRVGRLAAGYEADLVAFDVPAHLEGREALLDHVVFGLDAAPARVVCVRGAEVYGPARE